MSNRSTLPPEWQVLADAFGGVRQLQDEIGLPTMTFWRLTRGVVAPKPVVVKLVNRLAAEKDVPSPFKTTIPTPRPPKKDTRLSEQDVATLSLLGDNISRGKFPPPKTLANARKNFPEAELIRLAESDDTSELVQLAVAHILGLMDR